MSMIPMHLASARGAERAENKMVEMALNTKVTKTNADFINCMQQAAHYATLKLEAYEAVAKAARDDDKTLEYLERAQRSAINL